MVPFMKSAAEVNAQKAKALQDDLKRLQNIAAANDDAGSYHTKYFHEDEHKAANE